MTRGRACVTDRRGTLRVSYEDYNVEAFGGADYQASYTLDAGNRGRLESALREAGLSGSLRDMILAYFGEFLERSSFAAYCNAHGIEYELFTWIS